MGRDDVSGRRVIDTRAATYQAYDLEGPRQPELSWLPISYDERSGNGCYFMRFEPGGVTIPHEHTGTEDFLILEGELTDSDGTVFRPGDFVSYEKGTKHNSWSDTGCVLVVFEWGKADSDTA